MSTETIYKISGTFKAKSDIYDSLIADQPEN